MLIDKVKSFFVKEKPINGGEGIAWSESLLYASSNWPKYNPDDLIGRKGFAIYRQMMIDEQVKAVVRFKRDAITSRKWFFEGDDEERNEILKAAILNMDGSFVSALNGVMSSIYNGFSITEKKFEPFDYDGTPYIGVKKLSLKPYDSFQFNVDEYGNLIGIIQKWENREQEIDPDWVIHHIHNSDTDQHYGRSELREAYRSWFSKDMAIRFYNIFLERHATGFVWAKPIAGSKMIRGSTEYTDLVSALNSIQAKTSMIVPSNIELNFQTPANNVEFERAIALHDKAIAKALLVPNLLGITEQGDTGSYAQSKTQLEAFLWTLDLDVALLEETINEQLVWHLGELNFGDGEYPKFRFKPISDAMKLEIIKTWKDLVSAGAVERTDEDEGHIRKLMEFPEKGEVKAPKKTESEEIPDETIIGKGQVKTSRAFSRAVRRVDFSLIDKNSAKIALNGTERAEKPAKDLLQFIKDSFAELDLLHNPERINEMKPSPGKLRKLKQAAYNVLKEAWEFGQEQARKELGMAKLARFAGQPLMGDAADKFFEGKSYSLAGDTFDGMRKEAAIVLYNAIKGSWSLDEVYDELDDLAGSKFLPYLATAIRTIVFESINEARYSYFEQPELEDYIVGYEYSAILDGKTTPICRHLDGKQYADDSPVWEDYRPPNHFNCRSLLIAITKDDEFVESDPPDLQPAEGFS